MRCASSVMSGTEQGPDRKTAGLPFMANHTPMGRGLPSSRFDPPGPKHPRRGTMFPDGSGVPLRFTKENCHVCKSSNESTTARRRAARRVGTRSSVGPAATAPGRPAASCRGVRVHSSASRLVTRPATRSTRPVVRFSRTTDNDADLSAIFQPGEPTVSPRVPVRSPTKEFTPC